MLCNRQFGFNSYTYLLNTKKQYKFDINKFCQKNQKKNVPNQHFSVQTGDISQQNKNILCQNLYPNVKAIRVVFVFISAGVEAILSTPKTLENA